jgi:hypothetical protein
MTTHNCSDKAMVCQKGEHRLENGIVMKRLHHADELVSRGSPTIHLEISVSKEIRHLGHAFWTIGVKPFGKLFGRIEARSYRLKREISLAH